MTRPAEATVRGHGAPRPPRHPVRALPGISIRSTGPRSSSSATGADAALEVLALVKECSICHACADDAVELCPNDSTRLEITIPGSTRLDGKYELERRLGAGGMGVVYRALHLDLHRSVAIKIIASTREGFADRFRIEAAALGRLKHPNIVDVMDFGVDDERGMAYLVMELLEGVTLAARCDASGLPPRREAVEILEKVAAAVDFAHDHDILHRDLKPANVFLVRSTTGTSIKMLDFGLA